LGIRENVRVLPFLSVAELAAVYRRAALLVLPSEAEGFGLPVIEAMANGTAVLAADLPVLREVGGDAAEYARIGDVNDWALKATALLHEHRDSGLRELRRSRCRAQAAKFSWTETATRLVEIYDQVSAEAGMKR
jgi:glycosyltransferase involved in cell wall biosynthesis